MSKHRESLSGRPDAQQITLRSPAELADALPYMMGFQPSDSIVLVALHGRRGRFGGRVRLGIPRSPAEWSPVAEQLAGCLVHGSERRGERPDGMVVFLCRDPEPGEGGERVMERLRPLAQRLRTACGALDVPVLEALCVSGGRFWSYCCPDARCCPPEGTPLALPGTSVMAAAAAYAGVRVRGSQKEMEARLAPRSFSGVAAQTRALDDAGAALLSRALEESGRRAIAVETLDLARRLMDRLARSSPGEGAGVSAAAADAEDDRVISAREAAALILGLQDRRTRDRAAQWMEGADAVPALRLWRALARRCAGLYQAHAAAPLTLAGWVSWATGDEPSARVALGLALRTDPGYVFAQLLHQACNEGIDPETLRHCLRQDQDWPTAPDDTSRHLLATPGDVADSGSAAAARGARATEDDGPPRGGTPRPLPRPSARRTRRGRRAAPAGASPLPRPGGSGSAASGAEPRQGEGTLPGGRPVPGAGRRSRSSARRLRRRTRRIASGTGRPAVGTPGRRHPGRAPRDRTADGAVHARR
ncbi:DUF4192 domain-containing protein [Streptomyces zhihengii]|uniref:DUF4192 domain-containing protein n=1 Tax=Streptomyces zhihengii TaxID=1818004 RepID=UPI00363CCFD8